MNARRIAAAVLSLVIVLGGCRKGAPAAAAGGTTVTFPIHGKVVSANTQTKEILLQHDAIPGFMEAMTMPYPVPGEGVIAELHPGDTIDARLVTTKDADGEYHHAYLDQITVLGQTKPDYVPQKHYNTPKVGDPVPDFKLVDQSAKKIHLSQFHGKALLITFIYTRCPLGDYCPKMSRNFAEIHQSLLKDKLLGERSDLLSVSFDPVYDTPAVLKSYGAGYTGRYTQETFDQWQFAAPAAGDLPAMEQFFDVGVTGDGATLTHSLSTVLVGPDGKIAAWYPGNEWQPAAVLAKMREITSAA